MPFSPQIPAPSSPLAPYRLHFVILFAHPRVPCSHPCPVAPLCRTNSTSVFSINIRAHFQAKKGATKNERENILSVLALENRYPKAASLESGGVSSRPSSPLAPCNSFSPPSSPGLFRITARGSQTRHTKHDETSFAVLHYKVLQLAPTTTIHSIIPWTVSFR